MTPEARLVAAIAEQATARIARRVVRDLQQIKDLHSGDDSGLGNTWDEICVQRQGDDSIFWDMYDQMVLVFVEAHVDEAPVTDLQAIWLQTNAGDDWIIDADQHAREMPWNPADVVQYVVHAVYELAGSWSNHRIRKFQGG